MIVFMFINYFPILLFSTFVSSSTICKEYGHRVIGNRCFLFISKTASYYEARDWCILSGGDIATIFRPTVDVFRSEVMVRTDVWYPVDPGTNFSTTFDLVNGQISEAEWGFESETSQGPVKECLTIIPYFRKILKTQCTQKFASICEFHPGKQKLYFTSLTKVVFPIAIMCD